MPRGGKRPGAGRPVGSGMGALVASTGQKVAFAELAKQYDREALEVIVAAMRDEAEPMSVRVAAANSLLDRAYGRPPQALAVAQEKLVKHIYEIRWLPPDPNDRSNVIEPEPD